jgi:hypothetical protein
MAWQHRSGINGDVGVVWTEGGRIKKKGERQWCRPMADLPVWLSNPVLARTTRVFTDLV